MSERAAAFSHTRDREPQADCHFDALFPETGTTINEIDKAGMIVESKRPSRSSDVKSMQDLDESLQTVHFL
jgi:hypothetical protein